MYQPVEYRLSSSSLWRSCYRGRGLEPKIRAVAAPIGDSGLDAPRTAARCERLGIEFSLRLGVNERPMADSDVRQQPAVESFEASSVLQRLFLTCCRRVDAGRPSGLTRADGNSPARVRTKRRSSRPGDQPAGCCARRQRIGSWATTLKTMIAR